MASPKHEAARSRTSSKALRLLGLSEMPLEAGYIEHPNSLPVRSASTRSMSTPWSPQARTHGSRTPGTTPPTPNVPITSKVGETGSLERDTPPSLRSSTSVHGNCRGATAAAINEDFSSPASVYLSAIDSSGSPVSASSTPRDGAGAGSGILPPPAPTTPRKLAVEDIDDAFLEAITALMTRFPKPPRARSIPSAHTSSAGIGVQMLGGNWGVMGTQAAPVAPAVGGGAGSGQGETHTHGVRGLSGKPFCSWKGQDKHHYNHQQLLDQLRKRQGVDIPRVQELSDPVKRTYVKNDVFEL